jgi:hypothetical protein
MRIRDGKNTDPGTGMEKVGSGIRNKHSRIRNIDWNGVVCPLVQYAEIADIHPVPADLEVTTLTHVSDITTLPKA